MLQQAPGPLGNSTLEDYTQAFLTETVWCNWQMYHWEHLHESIWETLGEFKKIL